MMRTALVSALLIAAPVSAAMGGGSTTGGKAVATIKDAAGKSVGTATVTSTGHGLKLVVSLKGLAEGERALHLHTSGTCEAPKFTTAGPHWNPANKQHGKDNPAGPHAGDAPNILIKANGKGTLTYEMHGGALTGEGGLLDADGGAVIVHAKPDDYKTDPTGNAGDRIACGVFAKR